MVRLKFRAAVLLAAAAQAPAARLTQPAQGAFDAYTASVEARLGADRTTRTRTAAEPSADRVRVEPVNGGSWQVTGGLIHDWRGAALVPGATAEEMLALLRDFNHLDRYYAPDVVSSRALSVDGERTSIAMRFRKQHIVTVVLDAEFETLAAMAGGGRGYSVSRSTHVWQVEKAGTAGERRRPEGDDDGFLWRLNSYWNFEERREGLLMECEAVSLTRDVPMGLGWLVLPVIQSLPRASLEFTMSATRNALAAKAAAKATKGALR